MATELRFSRLRWMARSAAHYRVAEELASKETPARRLGTATHALALGGEILVYDGERKGNAWKAFEGLVRGEDFLVFDGAHSGKMWKAAKEEAAGRLIVTSADVELASEARARMAQALGEGRRPLVIVTSEERERAARCADAVRCHPIASSYLGGEHEVELRWRYLERDCGGRVDILHGNRVAELKTSTLAAPGWLTQQALRLHYIPQLVWYGEGARANGYPIDDYVLIGVEVEVPHPVTVMRLSQRAREFGEKQLRLWMERLAVCESSGEFPEYTQTVETLDVPEDDFALRWGDEEAEAA